jgi:hypothetical protein
MNRWHLAPLAIALFAVVPDLSAAELLSVEEAEARSKATGRPILAMAGSKT